ncbi:MAG: 50S ribosomal protein L25 [Candidatus Wolfebacteria bacterium]|nr:50S ribosomal protein L25 [Candidatus Wolfebacteria bacterium]
MTNILAQKREIFGKKTKSLRSEGLIPAELYGHGFANEHLSVSAREFAKILKEVGESSVVKLKIEDNGGKSGTDLNVLIHDVQKNSLTDEIMSIDFYEVRMDQKIKTNIPLHFMGEAPAVKEYNGVLIRAIQELEVEALPGDLPQHIEVDLSRLTQIGENIHVKDLTISDKIRVSIDSEAVVATVTEQAKEEEIIQPVSVEDVKVEGEEKKKQTEETGKAEEEKK